MAVLAAGELCAARRTKLASEKHYHNPDFFVSGDYNEKGRFVGTKARYACARAVCGETAPNLITHEWERASCKRCNALRNASEEELLAIKARGKRTPKVASGPPEKEVPLHPQTSLFAPLTYMTEEEITARLRARSSPSPASCAPPVESESIFHRSGKPTS